VLNAYIANKSGSGFDIACAIMGSQFYSRFTNIRELDALLADIRNIDLLDTFVSTFDYKFKPFKLPCGIALIDVNSGSDTRIMVKNVLEYARDKEGVLFRGTLFQELHKEYGGMELCL